MKIDYGFFLVRPNPYSPKGGDRGRLFVFSGAHTYGTQATAEMLFSPHGAAGIAERFHCKSGEEQHVWRRRLSGVIQVRAKEKKESVEGLECIDFSLIGREREIDIIEPAELQGVRITNPIMSPTLDRFYD